MAQALGLLHCRNKDGQLWASVLAGPKGFIQASKPTVLVASPLTRLPGDPAELNVGDHVGTLTIKLETRQRERVNGIVTANEAGKLAIAIEQSFSGCPKYIQGTIPIFHLSLELAHADQCVFNSKR